MNVKFTMIIYTILLLTLTSCGTADIQVMSISPAEATNQAMIATETTTSGQQQDPMMVYTNDVYGLTFTYPSEWELNASENFITLVKDGVHLNFGLKREGDSVEILGTGLPAGEMKTDKDNPIRFIGQNIIKTIVALDNKVQVIMYGTGVHQYDNIQMTIRADAIDTDASLAGISPAVQRELDAIVESVELTWLAVAPAPQEIEDWHLWEDEDFPYTLRYPDTWELESTPSYGVEETEIVIAQNLTLLRDEYAITISSRLAGVDSQIGPSGMPAGELQKGDPLGVLINGQVVKRTHAVLNENTIIVVYAGDDGIGSPVQIGDYEFAILLIHYSEDNVYNPNFTLPQDVRDEVDAILATLSIVED